jgi:hypothetical protein
VVAKTVRSKLTLKYVARQFLFKPLNIEFNQIRLIRTPLISCLRIGRQNDFLKGFSQCYGRSSKGAHSNCCHCHHSATIVGCWDTGHWPDGSRWDLKFPYRHKGISTTLCARHCFTPKSLIWHHMQRLQSFITEWTYSNNPIIISYYKRVS